MFKLNVWHVELWGRNVNLKRPNVKFKGRNVKLQERNPDVKGRKVKLKGRTVLVLRMKCYLNI